MLKLNFVSKTAETVFFFTLSACFLTKKYYFCGELFHCYVKQNHHRWVQVY